QVNTGEEPQKSGVMPGDLEALLTICRDECGLKITGLMCIPPVGEEPAMHFALLRSMAERYALAELSMGMSGDFEDAIAFGATSIRVGSAIFGARDSF
ncbi:MAG: YggS family pyridoxal phosphate enzyme, partial [SAR116 cluster bacterium]|nr:YggS family pyridoxal phosphate enzyme [SAR116 cluster bacterium]